MDIWKHGKFVDLWSVVHLASGYLIAGLLYWRGYGFWAATLIAFILLLAWEAFEWVTGIIEPSVNVLVDILIGLVGFGIGATFYYLLGIHFQNIDFWIVLAVTLGLSLWGFLDFKKRGYR